MSPFGYPLDEEEDRMTWHIVRRSEKFELFWTGVGWAGHKENRFHYWSRNEAMKAKKSLTRRAGETLTVESTLREIEGEK